MYQSRRQEIGSKSVQQQRAGNNFEPFHHHQMPGSLYSMFLKELKAGSVVDMGACQGTLALECIKLKVPYTGVAFSDQHAEMLTERLIELIFQEMLSGDSVLKDTALQSLVAKDVGEVQQPKPKKRKQKDAKDDGELEDPNQAQVQA